MYQTLSQQVYAKVSPTNASNSQNLYKTAIQYLKNGTDSDYIHKCGTYSLFSLYRVNLIDPQQFPTNIVPIVLHIKLVIVKKLELLFT